MTQAFCTRLLITPNERDFDYRATGGTLKMALIPIFIAPGAPAHHQDAAHYLRCRFWARRANEGSIHAEERQASWTTKASVSM